MFVRSAGLVVLAVIVGGAVAGGVFGASRAGAGASVRATQVIRWSPFTKAGTVKPSLTVTTYKGGCDSGSSSARIGGVGYRCGLRIGRQDYLIDPCWRDGAGRARAVVCVTSPWDRKAYRLRVPTLMIDNGVTFAAPTNWPWAISLADGNHCVVLHGAVDRFSTPTGQMAASYSCADNVVLGNDLRRGHVWTITAVRWIGVGYSYLGHVAARQAFLGALPPGLARQNRLARAAARVASRVIRLSQNRVFGKRDYEVAVNHLRLALPDANWAQVYAWVFWGSGAGLRNASLVLHRVNGQWVTAGRYRPFCMNLRPRIRRQLFTKADCA